MDVIDKSEIWDAIVRDLNELSGYELRVGVQGDEGSAIYDEADGVTVAEVAAKNEFGTDKIPSRPFMRQSAEKHENWGEEMGEVWNSVIDGNNPKTAMHLIGQKIMGDIQEEIATGDFVPNAPYTIKKKGSDRPLIDTGQLRKSITYKVE